MTEVEIELPYKENYFLRHQVNALEAKIKTLEFNGNEKVELTAKVRELETRLYQVENARATCEHQVSCLAEAITKASFKAGITADPDAAFSGPQLMLLADDLAEVILNMESNICGPCEGHGVIDAGYHNPRECGECEGRGRSLPLLVPLSADGKYVFIDGPGDVELDWNRDLEKLPEIIKTLEERNDRLMNDLATAEFEHDEDMYRALEAIIDRSKNGELGTSKVIDMRKIAEKALANLK